LVFQGFAIQPAPAAQAVNVQYIHDYIQQKHGVTVPIKTTTPLQIANVKYLLCAVDKTNALCGGATTSYCTHALATQQVVDTVATIDAVNRLVQCGPAIDLPQISTNTYPTGTYCGYTLTNACSSGCSTYGNSYWNNSNHTNINANGSWTNSGSYAWSSKGGTYYIQGICSTTGSYGGDGEYGTIPSVTPSANCTTSGSLYCLCRLKRISDNKAGDWVKRGGAMTDTAACYKQCAFACIDEVASDAGKSYSSIQSRFITNIMAAF
jgi:hypothetical protein